MNRTHLELLDEQARLFPDRTLFWVPVGDDPNKPVEKWTSLSYSEFRGQVLAAKRFYATQFAERKIAQGSVVGLWLSGNHHTDLCHTLGVSAAGYVPQLFSLLYSHSPVVFELLVNSGAKALAVDPSLTPDLSGCPVPVIDISNVTFTAVSGDTAPLQDRPYEEVKDDLVIILHSSGSTARIPKLIPWSHRFLTSAYAKFKEFESTPPTSVRIGNFNHGAAMIFYFGSVSQGASMIMPSQLAYSSEELINMIQFCGLTKLVRFATLLAATISEARQNPALLSALKSLGSVEYGALAFPPEHEQWAQSVGLDILNVFANTECGPTMRSTPGRSSSHLKPIKGFQYRFVPIEETAGDSTKLLEFVIPAGSPDLPHQSLLDQNGDYPSGDLFEEADDGYYIWRGRKNDWIKCGVGMICDTKSIEDAVRQHCKDLISDCVVVGANRRSPALIVEAAEGVQRQQLPPLIIERLSSFNKGRFAHERIDDPGLVLVADHGVLPRTAAKGNIRRNAAEETFRDALDKMYEATN